MEKSKEQLVKELNEINGKFVELWKKLVEQLNSSFGKFAPKEKFSQTTEILNKMTHSFDRKLQDSANLKSFDAKAVLPDVLQVISVTTKTLNISQDIENIIKKALTMLFEGYAQKIKCWEDEFKNHSELYIEKAECTDKVSCSTGKSLKDLLEEKFDVKRESESCVCGGIGHSYGSDCSCGKDDSGKTKAGAVIRDLDENIRKYGAVVLVTPYDEDQNPARIALPLGADDKNHDEVIKTILGSVIHASDIIKSPDDLQKIKVLMQLIIPRPICRRSKAVDELIEKAVAEIRERRSEQGGSNGMDCVVMTPKRECLVKYSSYPEDDDSEMFADENKNFWEDEIERAKREGRTVKMSDCSSTHIRSCVVGESKSDTSSSFEHSDDDADEDIKDIEKTISQLFEKGDEIEILHKVLMKAAGRRSPEGLERILEKIEALKKSKASMALEGAGYLQTQSNLVSALTLMGEEKYIKTLSEKCEEDVSVAGCYRVPFVVSAKVQTIGMIPVHASSKEEAIDKVKEMLSKDNMQETLDAHSFDDEIKDAFTAFSVLSNEETECTDKDDMFIHTSGLKNKVYPARQVMETTLLSIGLVMNGEED